MGSEKQSENVPDVDVNSTDFYNKIEEEYNQNLARTKKNLDVVRQLRMTAAEMEVETAALYHAVLFRNIAKTDPTAEIVATE